MKPKMSKRNVENVKEDELLCRGHILNTLSDRLYDLFTSVQSPREIWNALEFKYNTKKQGADKFLALQFFDFNMVDHISVLDQVHELHILVSKLKDLKVDVGEPLQVGAIIAKLPPSWNDYRKKLLHSSESFTLEQLQKHLRIEEETRIRDGKRLEIESGSKVNFVAVNKAGTRFENKSGNKRKTLDSSSNNNSKKDKTCFYCKKKGHFKQECRFWKKMKNDHAGSSGKINVAEAQEKELQNLVAMVSEMQISMVTEVNIASVSNTNDWWYDSGATIHICNDKNQFKHYEVAAQGHEVLMGNNYAVKVHGKGTIEIHFNSGKKLILINVLHVPEIRKNLISANLLCKGGFKTVLEPDKLILSKNGVFVGKGYACDGMFKLSINSIINNKNKNISVYMVDSSINLWHSRLAHVNFRSLKFMAKNGYITYRNDNHDKCEICIQAKMTKLPFPKSERNSEILQIIHSDICELNGNLTRGGNRYFATFIDDYSRYTYVYLMKHKDEVFDKFKVYKSIVENQKEKKIKILRSDRGGEYFPANFSSFCEEHGIIHQRTSPYTPQQNGLAERKNRTLVDMVNSMLLSSKLPFNLWGEALISACHIHNRIPSKITKTSPYELWNGRKPNLSYIRVWGCLAFYRVPDPKRTKLGPRAKKSVFVGYAENSKAYRLLDLESNVIMESRDVQFLENKTRDDSTNESTSLSGGVNETNIPNRFSSPLLVDNRNTEIQKQVEIRRSQRTRKEKILDPDFISSQAIVFLVEGDRTNNVLNKIPILLNVEEDITPKTYKEALASRDSSFWKEAINDEIDSLLSNGTWVLVDPPPNSKPIGCKWIFRIKDGNLFKARLVAKGYRQKEGVDYFDTYAHVARITSIRLLFALASIYNLCIHQMDVKTAFLNGDLNEEVYMEQPEGFVLPGNEHKVCKLTKSLYGLKQAPKQWHEKFDSVILEYGFKHNGADKCIYSKFT